MFNSFEYLLFLSIIICSYYSMNKKLFLKSLFEQKTTFSLFVILSNNLKKEFN